MEVSIRLFIERLLSEDEKIDSLVISLYAKGNSLKDIRNTISDIYFIELSEETISNMTSAVSEEVISWQNRPLHKCYPFVYVDCLYCSVKEDLRSMQRCIVHITRNIYSITAKKDCKQVISDFKKIYISNNFENAKLEFENFGNKYKENKKIMKKVEDNISWIFQIYEYPPAIRKAIYTTNAIESLNSSLRKVTKGKGSFINETALMKVLYLRIKDLQKQWSKGIANWNKIRNELLQIFDNRFLQYIDI